MNAKWMTLGIGVFAVFLVGMIYLGYQDASKPDKSLATFITYAEELGLDIDKFTTDYNTDMSIQKRIDADMELGRKYDLTGTPSFFVDGVLIKYKNPKELDTEVKKLIEASSGTKTLPAGSNSKGGTNPKVIIEEFSDFECPACSQISPYINELIKAHPNDIAVIYKHFPLPMHPSANKAAHAAEAAAGQGKFWEMHDILFERQHDWS